MDAHRPTARARAAYVATLVLLVLVVGLPPARADDGLPLAPVAESPPREASPFTRPDQFCTLDATKPPPNLYASAPGVGKHTITVVMLTPPVDRGGTTRRGDLLTETRTFGDLVNECGGIFGRRIDLQLVEQTADSLADCRAVDQRHAFVVVSWTEFEGASCVAGELKTAMIASGTEASNSSLLDTQGRLAVTSTTEGVLSSRVLDLIRSGDLDGKRVAVLTAPGGDNTARSVRQVLATADPKRKVLVVPATSTPLDVSADVVITTAFDPSFAELAHQGPHPVAVYSLGDASDEALDVVRTGAGVGAARAANGAGVYGWISPDLAEYRNGKSPTKFATMCNRAYDAARLVADGTQPLAKRVTTTTSTALPAVPDGPNIQIAEICLAWRTAARALYNAGPVPTQRSLVRALYRLPNIDHVYHAPSTGPNQVINEPVRNAGQALFLAKAEYPCVQPEARRAPANAQMCWVPASGWGGGHAVSVPLSTARLPGVEGLVPKH
jgi:hypothetical protein